MDLLFAFEIRRIIVMLKHQAKSTTNARLNKAASMLAAVKVAPRPRATTTIQQLTAGVGPLPTLAANRAARVAPPRTPAAATLLAANQAPRVPTTTNLTALGVGPLPTLVENRAARVASPRTPAAATLLVANRAARVSLPPATLALTAGVRIGVQLPTTPRPHLPCVTLQSLQLQKSL